MIENATYYYVIYQATAIAIIVELVKINKIFACVVRNNSMLVKMLTDIIDNNCLRQEKW